MLGYDRDAAFGLDLIDFIHEDSLQTVKHQISRQLIDIHRVYELVLKNKSGDKIPVIMNATSVFDEDNSYTGSFAFITNISDRKKAEKELQKIDKLRSIGTLAGGIAHDFNNILSGIYGNISMLQIKYKDDTQLSSYLDSVMSSMARATNLTRQLLTFSKGGNPVKETVQLSEILIEVVKFDLSGSNMKPIFDIPNNIWDAEVDKGQIQQVFSNLTINANQATLNGGHFFVKMKNVKLMKDQITELDEGNYIEITFRDEGKGISKEIIEKIFDPYFTTKKTGNGLGLATTYSIIKKHSGKISIKSELGVGTTFVIYLPALDRAKEAINHSVKKKKIISQDTKNLQILIMDDEHMICKLVTKMLKSIGHNSVAVNDGQEAIKIYKENFDSGNPFDYVIMDLTIPGGMGGKEAVKHILDIDKDAKVIVSSGYSNDTVVSNYEKHGFVGYMHKPYSLADMKKIFK
jgi:PAS domain S-box-containing protein